LATFLIEQNYRLDSADLRLLFTFSPQSAELADSQHAFRTLAQDHLRFAFESAHTAPPGSPDRKAWRGGFLTIISRLRGLWPFRSWDIGKHNGEVVS
jgi:hypothetical protein